MNACCFRTSCEVYAMHGSGRFAWRLLRILYGRAGWRDSNLAWLSESNHFQQSWCCHSWCLTQSLASSVSEATVHCRSSYFQRTTLGGLDCQGEKALSLWALTVSCSETGCLRSSSSPRNSHYFSPLQKCSCWSRHCPGRYSQLHFSSKQACYSPSTH